MRPALAAVVTIILVSPLSLPGQTFRLVAFSGGGFAGRDLKRAVETPAFTAGRLVPDSVDLEKNGTFDWRPALSGGVEIQARWTSDWYVGLGGYFAALTEENDNTTFFPGVAVSLGNGALGVFMGYILTTSNDVAFPDGTKTFRVGRDQIPDLRTDGTSNFGRFYIGFRGVDFNVVGGSNGNTNENGN